MDRYTNLEILGSGSYGTVHKAIDNETGKIVAIKHIDISDDDMCIPSAVYRECALLSSLKHDNIVELLAFNLTSSLQLVFEYVELDLHKVLGSYRKHQMHMPADLLVKYTRDLLHGVHACHACLIAHRDLKPQNVLVGESGLKICDFGLARLIMKQPRVYTSQVMTLWYRAPEILLASSVYATEVDMWSAGCIVAEMSTNRPLFHGDSEIGTLLCIMKFLGTPTEATWPGVTLLTDWQKLFPSWQPQSLDILFEKRPGFQDDMSILLRGLLRMFPSDRLMARDAKTLADAIVVPSP
eukprot:TRINITY_DN3455_c0_g1_i2.p1 TRINITY_DN3455_c0_g1~~TRINITY_DN3455_c0_g1_i2.p1  ORF type:complete len:296 (+),score=37.18 TRINITY_DN3455_c0_g1_i2:54-941(+)